MEALLPLLHIVSFVVWTCFVDFDRDHSAACREMGSKVCAAVLNEIWPTRVSAVSHESLARSWPMNVSDVCVVIIFSLAGITLKTSELRNAVKYPKALIIGLVLILFVTPLLGFAYMGLSGHLEYEEFVIGLATFAVVPTTISSAVVIVGLVNGNSGLSLVLSVVTNIIGVITVPFILRLVIGAGGGMKPWDLLSKLCLTILVPVVGGKLISLWPPIAALAKRFALAIKLASSFFLVVIP